MAVPEHAMIDNELPPPDETQLFDPVSLGMNQDLADSLAKLGPRTTTHGTGDMATNGAEGPFAAWVRKWVADHVPTAETKAAQYGSNSLAKKGYRLAAAQGHAVTLPEALELGVAQYVMEKMDRVEDAMLRGQLPSDDTWVDVAVYALMVGFIRQNGHWL